MKKTAVIVMVLLLSACGGRNASNIDTDVVTTPTATSPSVSLVGTYVLVGYDRDGFPQAGYDGTMQIGWSEVSVQSLNPPPPFVVGICNYTMAPYPPWESLNATTYNAFLHQEAYAFRVICVTDNSMILTTWAQIPNGPGTAPTVHQTYWEKISDRASLS